MEQINGLNGLRAIAVILVIISHWFPATHLFNILPIGNIGVDIFFVLSGFLISRILFFQKKNTLDETTEKFKLIKNFIVRRALRIFPIYYLFLVIVFITNGSEIREGFVYYLTYTTNYYFYSSKDWHGFMAHLWSLAVEEQFYIVWPLLLFFVPKKYSVKLLIICNCIWNFVSFNPKRAHGIYTNVFLC